MSNKGKISGVLAGISCIAVLAIIGILGVAFLFKSMSKRSVGPPALVSAPSARIWFRVDGPINAAQSKSLESVLRRRAMVGKRADDARVAFEAQDVVRVDLWGDIDLDALSRSLPHGGRLEVMHAKNVSTARNPGRAYSEDPSSKNDVAGVRFLTRAGKTLKPDEYAYYQMIYGVGARPGKRGIGGWDVILDGGDVVDAYPMANGDRAQPHFKFSDEGGKKLSIWCRKFTSGENIAFVYDGKVLSIAPVKEGMILSTEAFIDGQYPRAYVEGLCDSIKAGGLPVNLTVIKTEKGATKR